MNNLMDDRDDDLRLPAREAVRRSALREEPQEEQDREFTLSTGTVLGIFFALALVCAVFFGFGYSMGRKSQQSVAVADAPLPAASDSAAPKPAPGAPVIQSIPGYLSQSEADAANRGGTSQPAKTTTSGAGTTVVLQTTPAPAKATRNPAASSAGNAAVSTDAGVPNPPGRPVTELRPSAVAPVVTTGGAAAGAGNYVQIAAVSHQEDADVLLSALKRRGYTVFARPGETDKLIHVQVGPFASRKDADAMRQKLLGDGYNAIVK